MGYKVSWDNGHACGYLAGSFSSRRAAEAAGRNWKREMVALDSNPAEARRAYQWEVHPAEVDDENAEGGSRLPEAPVNRAAPRKPAPAQTLDRLERARAILKRVLPDLDAPSVGRGCYIHAAERTAAAHDAISAAMDWVCAANNLPRRPRW